MTSQGRLSNSTRLIFVILSSSSNDSEYKLQYADKQAKKVGLTTLKGKTSAEWAQSRSGLENPQLRSKI